MKPPGSKVGMGRGQPISVLLSPKCGWDFLYPHVPAPQVACHKPVSDLQGTQEPVGSTWFSGLTVTWAETSQGQGTRLHAQHAPSCDPSPTLVRNEGHRSAGPLGLKYRILQKDSW